MSYDVVKVKQAATGQWMAIITSLCNVTEDVLDGEHHPCPVCGGKDRFRAFGDFGEKGGVICNQCEPKADGIAVVAWLNEVEFVEALSQVARFLRLEPERKRTFPGTTKRQRPPASSRSKQSSKKQNPKPKLKPKSWNPTVIAIFVKRNPQWSEEKLKACGAMLAEYRSMLVVAVPVNGREQIVGYTIFPAMKEAIPHRNAMLTKMSILV